MALDKKMLMLAAEAADINSPNNGDMREIFLGAVGVRGDGVLVSSRNVTSVCVSPQHHAETRLARKLTPRSTVWVARVARGTHEWAMAKPCPNCEKRLRSAGVTRIVYTIGPNEWGVIDCR